VSQHPLWPPAGILGLPVRYVVQEYERLGGASAPQAVLCDNGQEYLLKCTSLAPSERYVVANEVIFAGLAGYMGLPVLDCCIAMKGSEVCFASAWMLGGTFAQVTTADLFTQAENRDRVYEMVAMDIWLCNNDRHAQNMLIRTIKARHPNPEIRLLLLNDHSRCLMQPHASPAGLVRLISAPVAPYVILDFVNRAITEPAMLGQAVTKIETIPASVIKAAVDNAPPDSLPGREKPYVTDFLLERQARLRGLLARYRSTFVQLEVGEI
jgi:hypothetical protein